MPVVTIKYNLPDEEPELRYATQGKDANLALWSVAQEIFRPARKHGYPSTEIQQLMERLDTLAEADPNKTVGEYEEIHDAGYLIGLLESMFYKILEEYNVTLD